MGIVMGVEGRFLVEIIHTQNTIHRLVIIFGDGS